MTLPALVCAAGTLKIGDRGSRGRMMADGRDSGKRLSE